MLSHGVSPRDTPVARSVAPGLWIFAISNSGQLLAKSPFKYGFARPQRRAIVPHVPVWASGRWGPPVRHGHWRSCPMAHHRGALPWLAAWCLVVPSSSRLVLLVCDGAPLHLPAPVWASGRREPPVLGTRIRTYIHICIYIWICTYWYVYKHCVHLYMYTHTFLHIHMYINIVCICICIHIHSCIFTYVCIAFLHIHVCMHSWRNESKNSEI